MIKNLNSFLAFMSLPLFLVQQIVAVPRFGSKSSTLSFDQAGSYLILNQTISNFTGTLSLIDESVGRVTGQPLIFNQGQVQVSDSSSYSLTGSYSPQTKAPLEVAAGSTTVLPSGSSSTSIVVNNNTSATIAGAPNLTQPIVLSGATSVLNIGLQSQVSQNIELNGGRIVLDDNLSLQAGKQFVGGGTIDVNGRTLKLPKGNASTGNITFEQANDVVLSGNLIDSTEYNFTGNGQTSELNGTNYSWTFASGGFISVSANHTLYCVNIDFQNFANHPTHGYFDIAATSTVVFQGCTISLAGNYTHSQGTIEFGRGCRIIHNGYTFTTSGLAFLRVNGASLIYDSLDRLEQNPMIFTNPDVQKVLVNSGTISSSISSPNLIISPASVTLDNDITLASNSQMRFYNATPLSNKNITMVGNGHSIYFPRANSALFNLDANVSLTLTDLVLFDFNPAAISYGDANANIKFGASCNLQLFNDTTVAGSDNPWVFTGNSIINGKNNSLTLDGSGRFTINNGSTVTMQNLTLVLKNSATAIQILDSGSKLQLQNCKVKLESSGWTFSQGHLEINGVTEMFGGTYNDVNSISKFSFSTAGTCTVLTNSTLRLGKRLEFEYKANPANNLGKTYYTKRHLVLQDATAALELDGCVLHSTLTGLALDYGRLIVSDLSNFLIDGGSGRQAEIGSALDVFVKPSTTLLVTGTLSYNQTTLP